MRDPSCKKQEGGGSAKVGGSGGHGTDMEVVAGVVEGHDDHNETSQEIDGCDSGFGAVECGGHRVVIYKCILQLEMSSYPQDVILGVR